MGRGRKRRLSVEEELDVNGFFVEEKKTPQRPEQNFKVKGFAARSERQGELVSLIEEKEIVISAGPAGSGKTYCALATALSLLDSDDRFDQIILCKSVKTLPDEEIGFLKGSMQEKMEPFMMSYTWNIDKILGKNASKALFDSGKLVILPVAYIRGLSIDNSIVIIDEAQNLTNHDFKSLITRIGSDSKYIFLGDVEQIDMKKKQDSCLQKALDVFGDKDYIGTVKFERADCRRNKLIPLILDELEKVGI